MIPFSTSRVRSLSPLRSRPPNRRAEPLATVSWSLSHTPCRSLRQQLRTTPPSLSTLQTGCQAPVLMTRTSIGAFAFSSCFPIYLLIHPPPPNQLLFKVVYVDRCSWRHCFIHVQRDGGDIIRCTTCRLWRVSGNGNVHCSGPRL